MNDSTSQPAPVAKKPGRSVVGVAVVIVVILLILGGAFYAVRTGALTFYGMRYIAGSFNERALYQVGFSGPKQIALPIPGKVIGYARGGGKEVAIALSLGNEDVYLNNGGSWKALTKDGGIKAAPQISSDGSKIGYAFRSGGNTSSTTASTTDFYTQDAWSIHVIDRSSGKDQTIGTGYGPQFFTHNGTSYVLYTATGKISIVNLDKSIHQDIAVKTGIKSGFFAALVSPDGTYLALPAVSNSYGVFKLTEANGLFTIGSPLGSTPPGTLLAAFSGNTLVSVAGNKTSTFIRESDPAKPTTIQKARIFPLSQIVSLTP